MHVKYFVLENVDTTNVILYNNMYPIQAHLLMLSFRCSQEITCTLQALNWELQIVNFTMIGTNAQVMCTSTGAQVSLSLVQHVHISGPSFINVGFLQMEAALIVTKNACFNQNINNMVASVNTLIVAESCTLHFSWTALWTQPWLKDASYPVMD